MRRLADDGYLRAIDKLAYFHVKGFGVQADNGEAIRLYQSAVDQGNVKSLISLGKILISSGRPEDAFLALTRAAEEDVPGAEAILAWAHATGGFGESSRLDAGWQNLVSFARSRDRTAELAVLAMLMKQQRTLAKHHPNHR